MCETGQALDDPHSDEERLNVVDLVKDPRSSCSSNGDGVDEEKEALEPDCSAFGSALACVFLLQPSLRSSEFDWWGGKVGHQCYAQKEGTTIR